jgi:hypothetical protein
MTGTGEWAGRCRPATTTRASRAARRAATASPIPRVPPVTSARLPLRVADDLRRLPPVWYMRKASAFPLLESQAHPGQIPRARRALENVTYPGPAEPLRRVWIF